MKNGKIEEGRMEEAGSVRTPVQLAKSEAKPSPAPLLVKHKGGRGCICSQGFVEEDYGKHPFSKILSDSATSQLALLSSSLAHKSQLGLRWEQFALLRRDVNGGLDIQELEASSLDLLLMFDKCFLFTGR